MDVVFDGQLLHRYCSNQHNRFHNFLFQVGVFLLNYPVFEKQYCISYMQFHYSLHMTLLHQQVSGGVESKLYYRRSQQGAALIER